MDGQMSFGGTALHHWQVATTGLRGEPSTWTCSICHAIGTGPNEPPDEGCQGFASGKRLMVDQG